MTAGRKQKIEIFKQKRIKEAIGKIKQWESRQDKISADTVK